MFKHYESYYWKGGKPYGVREVDPSLSSFSYKIVSDPYYKRISVEKYRYGQFEKVVYDSRLLDFRYLTLKDQIAWQREILEEKKDQSLCLLRDQEDRAILIETLFFDQDRCRRCMTSSIHGIFLAIHRMYYRCLQDDFDGVILYDSEEHPVMMKTYAIDPITGDFSYLLSENWDMQALCIEA